MIRVGVVGAGYWGPNLIRNFISCPATELLAVCDLDAERLRKVTSPYPAVQTYGALEEMLQRPDLDAVAIATPAGTHGRLGLAALRAGKHVLMEKPLAASSREAQELVQEAQRRGLVLMTDHTFLFSPAVQRMKALIDSGDLGDLYFIDSVRINLGLFHEDVNVVWDLAPHDLSIAQLLLPRPPLSLSAFGASHAPAASEQEDLAHLSLDYGDGLLATFHLSWLSPVKIRQFIVGGSRKSIVYNDLEPAEKLKIYDRGIVIHNEDQRYRAQISYRLGDVWSPHLEQVEPLQTLVQHFARCIEKGDRPLSDGLFGWRIVCLLEAAQASIKQAGARLVVQRPAEESLPRLAA
jgi:predicted dehydrogenase